MDALSHVTPTDYDGQHVQVAERYTLHADGCIGFALCAYNTSLPLIVDRTLTYSRSLGGTGEDGKLQT